MDGRTRYTSAAQASHWITAVLFLAGVVLAWVFMAMPASAPGRFVYITLHKSIGQTIFFVALFRLVWRRLHPPPPMEGRIRVWEAQIAKVNHWLLYAIMIVMPLSGYILATVAARPSPYFWLFYWPQPTLTPAVAHIALMVHLVGQFFVCRRAPCGRDLAYRHPPGCDVGADASCPSWTTARTNARAAPTVSDSP